MQPIITAVRWSASNIPWGLRFSEDEGKITGTPTVAGEYVVPVTVETMCGSMYIGSDAKDLTVIVEPKSYPVYTVGQRASVWSNGATADGNGFYLVPAPNAYKLTAIRNGFIALTPGKIPYCCGTYSAKTNQIAFGNAEQMYVTANNAPIDITQPNITTGAGKILQGVERTICGTISYTTTSGNPTTTYKRVYVWQLKTLPKRYGDDVTYYTMRTVYGSGIVTYSDTGGFNYNPNYLGGSVVTYDAETGSGSVTGGLLFSDGISSGSSYLCANGTKKVTLTANKGSFITKVTDLGYKAKKYLNGTNFKCLSENGRLDNNASNFSYGVIKDAWCLAKVAYVITPNGVLYEHNASSNSWTTCGSYDIKKLSIPDASNVFMLTNNGRLYHKGAKISGLTEAHDNFTELFPGHYFHDFAFAMNTLALIKE